LNITTPVERAGKLAQMALTYLDHPDRLVKAIRARVPEAHIVASGLLNQVFQHPPGSTARGAALQTWAEFFEAAVDSIAREVIELDNGALPTHQQIMDEAVRVEWIVVQDTAGVRMRNSRLNGHRIILRRIVHGNPVAFHDITCERTGSRSTEGLRPLEFITRPASRGHGWREDMVNYCTGWRIYA